MSRVALGALLLAYGVILLPRAVEAGGGNGAVEGCETIVTPEGATTVCRDPGGEGSEPVGVTRPVSNPCTWRPVSMEEAFAGGGIIPPDPGEGFEYFEHADGSVGRRWPDGREEKGFMKECADGGGGFVWVDVTVSVQDVIDGAVARARQIAPLPALDVSPSPEAGGIVNLGMWLAVQAAVPDPIRVEAGGHWAVASLTPVSTTWSFGDGASVTCAGMGEPISDPSTVEQGPCGYTYATSSSDEAPYELTATLTWSVDYVSSGGSGNAGTVDRTVSVPYDVDEIQSVGTESRSRG